MDTRPAQEVQLAVDTLRSAKMGHTGVSALILDAQVPFSRSVGQVAASLLAGQRCICGDGLDQVRLLGLGQS